MTPRIDIKSSSRAGRFKKKLVGPEALKNEAPAIENKMSAVLKMWKEQKLTDAELTTVYIIHVLSHRFPGTWLGSKITTNIPEKMSAKIQDLNFTFEPNIQRRLQTISTLGELLNHFSFRSTPMSVNRSLLLWSTDSYPLKLMFRIPSSQEVLSQQKTGSRCVTLLTEAQRTQSYILGERDALSFTMHDLIHADHFYQHDELKLGQIGFYQLMDHSLSQGHFATLMENSAFAREFDYLISDMNAYPVHLMKCLKSAMIHYGHSDFENWVQLIKCDEKIRSALLDLNSESYRPQIQDQEILNYLLART